MTGACLSSHSKSQQNWDQQSNKVIGIKTELFLDTEGRAGREVSMGRDKVRHGNSERASQHPLVMFSVNQLRIHLLTELFMHPLLPHNPAWSMSSSLYCSLPPSGFPLIPLITQDLLTRSSSHLHYQVAIHTHISLSLSSIHPSTHQLGNGIHVSLHRS